LHFSFHIHLLTEKQAHTHDTFWRNLSLTCEKKFSSVQLGNSLSFPAGRLRVDLSVIESAATSTLS